MSLGVIDIPKLLVKELPDTLEVANGDEIVVVYGDAQENLEDPDSDLESLPAPFVRFDDTSFPVDATHEFTGRDLLEETFTESITYQSGKDTYLVTERHIIDVVELTGTADGNQVTFIEGSDFHVVSSEGHAFPDTIEWLDGQRPDDGTDFTVEYTHRFVADRVESKYDPIYRLTIYADDLDSGEKGATKDYVKSRLAQQLYQALVGELAVRIFTPLGGDEGAFIREVDNVGNVGVTDGQGFSRYALTVQLGRSQEQHANKARLIGQVDAEVRGDLPDVEEPSTQTGVATQPVATFAVGTS